MLISPGTPALPPSLISGTGGPCRRNSEAAMAKTAGDVFVETLLRWGVDTIFGLPGDGINGIMEALRKRQDRIRFVQVRHEEAAAFMACGYAKYTGRLGVCLATSGPGRHPSAQRAVRRQDGRRSRCWPSPAMHVPRSDRHPLPAGRRSRQAVQGRGRLQRADHGPGARRERRRPRLPHGAGATRRRAHHDSRSTSRSRTVDDDERSKRNVAGPHVRRAGAAGAACPSDDDARARPPRS